MFFYAVNSLKHFVIGQVIKKLEIKLLETSLGVSVKLRLEVAD